MNDIMNLASTLAGNFMGVVQYNGEFFVRKCYHYIIVLSVLLQITLDDLCDMMTNHSIADELDRYAAVNSFFLGNETLDVSYQEYIQFMKNTSYDSSAALGGKHNYYMNFYKYIKLLTMHYYCRSPVVLPDLYRVWILPVL